MSSKQQSQQPSRQRRRSSATTKAPSSVLAPRVSAAIASAMTAAKAAKEATPNSGSAMLKNILEDKSVKEKAEEHIAATQGRQASSAPRPSASRKALYDLAGDRAPMMPSSVSAGRSSRRGVARAARAKRWEWAPFTNPARTDGLQLHHWALEEKATQPYPFAKFDQVHIKLPSFSAEDYKKYLDNSRWTERETRQLLKLCEQYNLSFILIHDRYTLWVNTHTLPLPGRSVEDLKERYYECMRKLAKRDGKKEDSIDVKYRFDKKHEELRKEQLLALSQRTIEEYLEEVSLKAALQAIREEKRAKGITKETVRLAQQEKSEQDRLKSSGRKGRKSAQSTSGHTNAGSHGRADSSSLSSSSAGRQKSHGGGHHTRSTPSSPMPSRPSSPAPGTPTSGSRRGSVQKPSVTLQTTMFKRTGGMTQKVKEFVRTRLEELKLSRVLPTEKTTPLYHGVCSSLVALYNTNALFEEARYKLIKLREHKQTLLARTASPVASPSPMTPVGYHHHHSTSTSSTPATPDAGSATGELKTKRAKRDG